MQSFDYLVWNFDPTAFTIGPLTLPFPVAVWGILATLVIIYFAYPKLPVKERPEESEKEPEPSGWWVLLLVIGAFIAGQIIFAVLPSPTFQYIERPVRWYGIMWACAFLFGYLITQRVYKHAGRNQEELDKLFMYVIIATVIGARLGHVLFYAPAYYLRNPAEILAIWQGGLASHGAAAGILLAMYLYVKRVKDMSFLWLADRVVIVVALGGAFIRLGNFFNSEIVGKPADVPWAIVFPRAFPSVEAVPRHPSMLYEAILCLALFILLWAIYKKYKNRPPEGSLFGIFLVGLFGVRFWLEYYKADQAAFETSVLNMGQWLSIPLVLAGIWVLWKKVNWDSSGRRQTANGRRKM